MTFVKLNQPMHRSFNGLVEDILNELPTTFGRSFKENTLLPLVNIKETKEGYDLELAAPGRKKEDFKINLEKNILTISAESTSTQSKDDEKQIRKEFNFESFKRSFTVDEKIATDKIEAKYENGVLQLLLPKNEEVKATVKEINIA